MRVVRLHSVHALEHARGCMCPSAWVTSVPSTTQHLRLCRLCIPLVCGGGSRYLMRTTVASSLPLDSDQWPALAWAGPVDMTVQPCQTHWSSSPRSHDPSHVTLAGVANSVAALASSCSGKTFQQLASDCSRNICNVRHW